MEVKDLVLKDSSFSETDFISKVDNTFIMMLSSIINNDLGRVNHKIGDSVYDRLKEKLDDLNSKNYKQMYDELNVKSTRILSIEEDDSKYIITVELISRYLDYIVDKDTFKYISGNNRDRIELTNILTFEKAKDAHDFSSIIKKCPTCGGSIDFNHDGRCKFCKNVFPVEMFDWVLTNIKTY